LPCAFLAVDPASSGRVPRVSALCFPDSHQNNKSKHRLISKTFLAHCQLPSPASLPRSSCLDLIARKRFTPTATVCATTLVPTLPRFLNDSPLLLPPPLLRALPSIALTRPGWNNISAALPVAYSCSLRFSPTVTEASLACILLVAEDPSAQPPRLTFIFPTAVPEWHNFIKPYCHLVSTLKPLLSKTPVCRRTRYCLKLLRVLQPQRSTLSWSTTQNDLTDTSDIGSHRHYHKPQEHIVSRHPWEECF
jgi:hypothetical protein